MMRIQKLLDSMYVKQGSTSTRMYAEEREEKKGGGPSKIVLLLTEVIH
jgi:hypothetical protein